ncbi:right-handed parallel beta-helix repeat-containing protein [Methanobrevibacter gottschalkii]|nr:right-handed parallel beta-helix repeat-containing protein [Methanobrevibacter gottschalkii]
MIISVEGVCATDNDVVVSDIQSNGSVDDNYLSLASSDYKEKSEGEDIGSSEMETNFNYSLDKLRDGGKVIKLTESDFNNYFNEEGYVDTTKVSPYDTFDLSGSFKNVEVMIFTIPVTVTSTSCDAYLKDCTIQFDNVIASESKWAKVSNLRIENTIASGFNGVIATNSAYIEITNNVIYSESASGNPIRLLASNYTNVRNNVLETWYKSAGNGFNASWTHSCILLGESHHNYIANNKITVKESNPIYLSSYGCGPSNYNIIVNNTICSSSKSTKTGLSNPSSWTYGIQIFGSYNKALNNTIFNVFRGISTDGKCNEIVGNIIFNITGGYNEGNDGTLGGDYAIVGAVGSLIANNTIYNSKMYTFGGSGGSAIYVGPNNEVYGNKITVIDSSNGINIGGFSSNVNIYDNIINTESGNGVYALGHMKNLSIMYNVITSESGIGIQIKKQSNSKYPTNVFIINNTILTANEVFIDVNDVLNKSSLICENNTYKKIAVVTADNFFSYFDNEGNLKSDNIGILVFKGSFDSDDINVNSININQPVYILGNEVNIKNIQFNITSNNVVVEKINFDIEYNSAIYLSNADNVLLVRNVIMSSSTNPAIVVSKSAANILSNKIQSNDLAILVDYGSRVMVNNNLINVTGDYTIDLTNSGNFSSDVLKNNVSNNYLLANLKGDASVSYLDTCENNSIIYDNDGLISNLVVKDTVSFVNQNPMLLIYLLDFEGNYISNGKIRINLTDSKGQYTVYYVFTNSHGIALFEENIPVDNYTFSAVYDGNDIYKHSQVLNKKLDVIYMDTSLYVSDINTYYNVPVIIKATLKGNGNVFLKGKIVYITVNGKTYKNITVDGGVVTFNIGTLPKGNYTINYLFYNDENCTGSFENSKIFVKIMPTNIDARNVVMFYNDNSGIVAYLKDNECKGIGGKTVSIEINGKIYKKTTDKNGKFTLKVSLVPKIYSVSLKFSGDSNYKPSYKSMKVQVKTRITKIVASNLVKYYGDSKKLVIYLKDTNNKAVVGKSITIKINGKTYKRNTDKNGKASLSISLSKKIYKATIKFSAKYHKASSKKIKVSVVAPKVSALSKSVKKGKKLFVVFKTYNNKHIVNQKVYFKFKGKTYNLITNSKGTTTLTCNIKKGVYSVVVGFKSTSTYGTAKTNIKFNVV